MLLMPRAWAPELASMFCVVMMLPESCVNHHPQFSGTTGHRAWGRRPVTVEVGGCLSGRKYLGTGLANNHHETTCLTKNPYCQPVGLQAKCEVLYSKG